MITNLYWSSSKLGVVLVKFELNFNFLHRFSKSIFFFSPGATTPIGGCILQSSSGL